MSVSPERILVLMEELCHRLLLINAYSQDLANNVDYLQRCAEEVTTRLQSIANDAISNSEANFQLAEFVFLNASESLVGAQAAVADSETQVAYANQRHTESQQSLSLWKIETSKAEAWLARAIERLKEARSQVQAAGNALEVSQGELARANSELAWAQSAYETVGYDKDQNPIRRPVNTAPYVAAVNRAQHMVNENARWLQAAQQEEHAATEDRNHAQQRLELCRDSVQLATAAVQHGEQAIANARSGLLEAERAKSSGELAVAHGTRAMQAAKQAKQTAGNMLGQAYNTETLVGEARTHAKRLEDSNDDSTLVANSARLDLDHRQALLQKFNAPLNDR